MNGANFLSAHPDQKTILVIDDEPLVRQSMAVYLEDSGYNIIEAEHGEQGIGLFCEYQPDLVLCDLRMPVMDGMEVLRRVTNMSPQVPVIVVSGAGQIQDVVEALRLGALDYLVKPIADMSLLESAVENAFRQSEQQEKNLLVNDQVEQANAELKEHLDLLQQDQEAGRRAQLQLLPEPTADIGEYRFQHIIIPSKELSGDFIDYFQISPRYIGFYIADVSGQGATAAFVTMTLKSLFNEPIRAFRQNKNDIIINPHSLLLYLNKELCNVLEHFFIACT
jgi:DNA-binding response OmpR family regulator